MFVQPDDEVPRGAVSIGPDSCRPGKISDGLCGVEIGPLKCGWQEAGVPTVAARTGRAARVGNRDVRRQILVFASQRIGRPSPDAGKAIEREPGVHEVLARTVRIRLAVSE